jgi:hypothetical protein
MHGGFHGATDQTGRVVEQGWAACGYEQARECQPGRSWQELSAVTRR